MNKTIDINLAGQFYHIDEVAYLKLQRYLKAIKHSFKDTQGCDEILADIEARISELFTERIENNNQVIGIKEVDEVILIMGQPEDYILDDDEGSDNNAAEYRSQTIIRKLFRDSDNSYIGGVASGIGHYLKIQAVWIRLLWVLVALFSCGITILVYVLFWILVPEAKTTADKLTMKGEAVTIGSIEKKVSHNYDSTPEHSEISSAKKLFRNSENSYIGGVSSGLGHYLGVHTILVRLLWVIATFLSSGFAILVYALLWILVPVAKSDSDKMLMKNEGTTLHDNDLSYLENSERYNNRIKSNSRYFFNTLIDLARVLIGIFVKVIGILLILIGSVGLIGLFIGLFATIFTSNLSDLQPIMCFNAFNNTELPLWLASLLGFVLLGIPLFFMLYLGLKILIKNLKSIALPITLSLLGMWLISAITLTVFGVKQTLSHREKAIVSVSHTLETISRNDTLRLKMNASNIYVPDFKRDFGFNTIYNNNDDKVYYSQGIRLVVKSTTDSLARLKIEKHAKGSTYTKAKTRAKGVSYSYSLTNNELFLNNYFTIPKDHKINHQNLKVILYLPVGSAIYAYKNTSSYHLNYKDQGDLLDIGNEEHYLKVMPNALECMDCVTEKSSLKKNTKKTIKIEVIESI